MSREGKLVKNTFIIAVGTFLPKICSLVTLPIITAYLTKIQYGAYDLINTGVSLILPVLTLQLQAAAFRFLIEYRNDNEKKYSIITDIFVFITIAAIMFGVIFLAMFPGLPVDTKIIIAFYFFIDTQFIAVQQILRGFSLTRMYSFCSVVVSVLNMLFVIVTVSWFGWALNGVIISIALATFSAIVVVLLKTDIFKYFSLGSFSVPLLKEMLQYSWPMIPNSLSNWIISLSDRLVVTCFLGIEANAVYAAANKLPALFTSLQGTFVLAWQENASLSCDDEDVDLYYGKMFDGIMGILFAIIAMLIACTPIAFEILIKGDYSSAYAQMPILYMGMFFSAMASFIGGIYIANKRTKNVGITTMIAALTNLIIDLLLVKQIGLFAASISTCVSYFVLAVYRIINVQEFQKIKFNLKRIISILFFLLIICMLNYQNNLLTDICNFILAIILSIAYNRLIVVNVFCKLKQLI